MNRPIYFAIVSSALLVLAGCADGEAESPAARGEIVYKNVCIACHAADPSQRGSQGPAIAGASRELVEARVVHGAYPEGYTPKQAGQLMPKFPHLAGSVDDLAAFLAGSGS